MFEGGGGETFLRPPVITGARRRSTNNVNGRVHPGIRMISNPGSLILIGRHSIMPGLNFIRAGIPFTRPNSLK